MTKTLRQLPSLVLGAAICSAPAAAQDVAPPGLGLSIAGSVITVSLDAGSREWGGGGEAALRYTWASGLQLMAGGGYHVTDPDQFDETRGLWGGFAEVRLLLNTTAASASPFIGARAAYLSHSLNSTVSGDPAELSGDGGNFAAIFGVLARLSNRLAFEGYLTFGVGWFGDVELKLPDETRILSGSSAYTGGLKAGLVYSFGG